MFCSSAVVGRVVGRLVGRFVGRFRKSGNIDIDKFGAAMLE